MIAQTAPGGNHGAFDLNSGTRFLPGVPALIWLDKKRPLGFNSSMKLGEIPRLESASPAEKIELIDDLWASIDPAALPTPKSHLDELGKRLGQLRKHPGLALTPAAARKKIREKTGL